ncbi:regulating synaptic membrane exocytosis protein 2-like isoform X2 [Ptychodera flava]|uniref:regulating synaptic membrane exocytosis protein 2-like isoform X2 n=1 Tax=Ptychodera flava TaxID=63121 RepID=UPI00396A6997
MLHRARFSRERKRNVMFIVQIGSGRRRSSPNTRFLTVECGQIVKSSSAHEVGSHSTGPGNLRNPSMPDLKLDHLTPDEMAILQRVFEKQEAFEKAEEERIRNLDKELKQYEDVVISKESEKSTGCLAPVDLRLCRLCYSKKFADGVGRSCCDCNRRVCIQCGCFNISFDENERDQPMKNKWRCKMCILRRQLLCKTGQWYHGGEAQPVVKAKELKEKIQELERKEPRYTARNSVSGPPTTGMCSRPPRRRTSHQEFYYTSGTRDHFVAHDRPKTRSHSVKHKHDNSVTTQRETASSERRRRMSRRERRRLPQQHWRSLTKKESTSDSEAEFMNGHGASQYEEVHERIRMSHSAYGLESTRENRRTHPYFNNPEIVMREDSTNYFNTSFSDEMGRCKDSNYLSPYSSGSEFCDKSSARKERSLPRIRRMGQIDLSEGDERATAAMQSVERARSAPDKPIRRITLHREFGDTSSRTNGFGMHVVGGKVGANSTLGAFVTMVTEGGPAMVEGDIKEGDQILEWNYFSLINKTFEEVKDILDQSREEVNILVAHKRRVSHTKLGRRLSDNCESSNQTMQKAIDLTRTRLASQVSEDQYKELLNTPSTPRRKLPKSPVDIKAEQTKVSGRLNISILHNEDDEELIITVFQAENLPVRRTTGDHLSNPYVKIYLLPHRRELLRFRTDTSNSSSNPVWNKTFVYPNISKLELENHSLELTVWDDVPNALSEFMGEVLIDLRDSASEPRWYDLAEHDENSPPLPKPSPKSVRKVSPCLKPEQTMQAVMYHAKMRERLQRSMSISEAPPEENSDEEEFPGAKNIKPLLKKLDELNVDDSDASLRRSSKSSIKETDNLSERSVSSSTGSSVQTGRNRASTAPEDAIIGLRGSLRERLKRKLSVKGDVKKRSVSSHNLDSYFKLNEKQIKLKTQRSMSQNELGSNLPKAISDNWLALHTRRYSWMSPEDRAACRGRLLSSCSLDDTSDTNSIASTEPDSFRPAPEGDDVASVRSANEVGSLGPGQYDVVSLIDNSVKPVGTMKIGVVMTKGHLEVEVISAKGLPKQDNDQLPDTYVKTYLVEGNRRIQKKKTRVVKQSLDPAYRQMIRYSACDVYGRNLQIMVWERLGTLQHNHCLGEVQITLDELELCKHTVGWYTLFPSDVYKLGSNDSINSF